MDKSKFNEAMHVNELIDDCDRELSAAEETRDMVSLIFTGIAGSDPLIHMSETGNKIATFSVSVKHQPHLPPTQIHIVALGKQAVYAQQAIRRNALVMISGWFVVGKNKDGDEFIEVKAKHLRALLVYKDLRN